MNGYNLSEDNQATIESVRELAALIACQVRTEVPASQVSALNHIIAAQLDAVLQQTKPHRSTKPHHTAPSVQ